MIAAGDNVFELVSWKAANVGGKIRYWSNSFPFISSSPLTHSTAAQLCHNIATAEQFLYPPTVSQFGYMIWQWSQFEEFAARDGVYIWPDSRIGNRGHAAEDTLLEWEYALLMTKQTDVGRSGHAAFRSCVFSSEVVPYREGSWALKDSEPFGAHVTNLILYWLNNTTYQHAVFSRQDELTFPTDARRVVSYEIGTLTKLQSISDAQERKTFRARPYAAIWLENIPVIFSGIRQIYALANSHPDGMLKDDLPTLATLAGILKGAFEQLTDYWTEGITPEVMPNWRPTSGHDPVSAQVQALVVNAYAQIDDLADILLDLQEYPDERIPLSILMTFILEYSWFALKLERAGACRWTGTPISVDAALPFV